MKYFIVVITLLLGTIGWSQTLQFVFRGKIENSDLGKNEGGVSISIAQNGGSIATAQSASNGKYIIKGNINYNTPFEVIYTKQGFVSKKISFNLKGLNEEDIPASAEYEPIENLDIDIFRERENVDFSFLDTEPVAKFDWDEKELHPDLDFAQSSKMKARIQDLLNKAEIDKAKLEADYQAAIRAGDDAFTKKEYETALSRFEEALGYKPNEKYPADKIVELDALIKSQKSEELAEKQANEEYYNLIEAADNLRDKGEAEKAVSTYKQASTKRPSEQYPKDQISTIQAQIDAKKKEAEAQEAYDAAIKSGDVFMKQNSLRPARDKYEAASKLKPSEEYPKQKLKEIENKMKALEDQEAIKKKYLEAITAADVAYNAEDFKTAKEKYTEALTFESSSTYAKGRIELCDEKLSASKAEEERIAKIKELLENGNADLTAKKYESAIASYNQVLGLDVENAEAKAKITEAQARLEELENAAEQEKQYAALIIEGDKANTDKKMEDALAKYQQAKAIKDTPEVNEKIAAVQDAINLAKSAAEKDANYKALVAEAEAKYTANELQGAIDKFTEASKVDPTKTEPAKRIAEIQTVIDKQKADQAKNDQFAALMKEGNDLLAVNNLDQAKTKFEDAIKMDDTNPEPKAKIKEIEALIAKNNADKEKQGKLQAAIDAADKLYNESKWADAQAKYRDAITIDPANTYATERVSEIEIKIAEQKKKEQVESLLADANALREGKKLEQARAKYQEVLVIDPSNATATAQITAINSELAALQNEEQKEQAFADLKEEGLKLFADKKYPEAKQKLVEALSFKVDPTIDAKIKEIDDQIALLNEKANKDEQYAKFVSSAQASEANKDYAAAIASYEKASGVKPAETLPKTKITELKALVAEIQANSSTNEQYTNFINEAKSFEANEDLEAAINSYTKAKNLKPEEALPKTKITELTALIEAKKVNEAAREIDYKAAMTRGEKLMTEEKYLDAITAFNEALALKPLEKEPKERAAAAEEAERKRGDGDAQYEKILTVAESKIVEGDYTKAEELINRAKMFKPDDKRPDELLEQVKQLRARDKKYADLMADAESLAGQKNYQEAIAQFQKAKTLKPTESIPAKRIEELKALLKDTSSSIQKEEMFSNYMAKGEAAVTGEKFEEALGFFQNAHALKPEDQVCSDKINEIQQVLDDLANAKEADEENKAKFDAAIKEADKLFATGKYLDAKAKYDEALGYDSFSSYAKERGDECAKIAGQEAIVEAEEQYQKIIKVADKNFNEGNYEKAKEYYNRAINNRKTDPYPKKKLEEIKAIENPLVVKSLKLEPLGEEVNGTIDGGFIIATADEKRRFSKGTRIEQEMDKVRYADSELASDNSDNRFGTQNEIYAIWEKVAVSTDDSDASRDETIAKLKAAELLREENEGNNLAFEKGENLLAQGQLNAVTDEVALDYMQGNDKRAESVAVMKGVQTSQEAKAYAMGTEYTGRKYESDEAMQQVAIKVTEDYRDDYIERLGAEQKVDAAAVETREVSAAIGSNSYDNIQRQKSGIDVMQSKLSAKTQEDSEIAKDNNETLKESRAEVNLVALDYMQKSDAKSNKVTLEIAEVRTKVIDDNEGFDKVRTEANDRLKTIQSEHVAAEDAAITGQTEKYLENKERILSENDKREVAYEKANDAMGEKIAYVKGQDAAARSKSSQGQMSDEEARLNARQKIVNQEIAQNAKTSDEVKSREENIESVKDIQKATGAKISAEETAQRDKNLSAQQDIDKISSEPKEKVKIANSLGQEYPEGVSQETFTRKDEAGLVTTVITRRIVVIDGHADIYVRTQTSTGITYSKNDKPSLQHVWNSETQGPDLERHY